MLDKLKQFATSEEIVYKVNQIIDYLNAQEQKTGHNPLNPFSSRKQ